MEGAQELTKNELKAVKGGVTEVCAKALISGEAILKNGACPPEYPLAGGGCCFSL